MAQFVCEHCRYRMDKPKAPFRCPYCGREGTVTRVKSAADILKESEF